MTRSFFVASLVFLAALFPQGCSDRGAPVTPLLPEVPDNQPVALIVRPDSGRIGSPISIWDSSFNAHWNYLTRFPGADDVLIARCDSLSTVHSFVPFGAVTGRISVVMGNRQGLTQPFVVRETSDTSALHVTRYDIAPPVTMADSYIVDFLGDHRAWQADVSGDSVHISIRYSTGEEIREIHFILLNLGGGDFPKLLSCWTYIKFDYPGSRGDTIRTGLLKIQDWNINGVMSARFFGRPSLPTMLNGTVVFWVDKSH